MAFGGSSGRRPPYRHTADVRPPARTGSAASVTTPGVNDDCPELAVRLARAAAGAGPPVGRHLPCLFGRPRCRRSTRPGVRADDTRPPAPRARRLVRPRSTQAASRGLRRRVSQMPRTWTTARARPARHRRAQRGGSPPPRGAAVVWRYCERTRIRLLFGPPTQAIAANGRARISLRPSPPMQRPSPRTVHPSRDAVAPARSALHRQAAELTSGSSTSRAHAAARARSPVRRWMRDMMRRPSGVRSAPWARRSSSARDSSSARSRTSASRAAASARMDAAPCPRPLRNAASASARDPFSACARPIASITRGSN